MEIIHVKLESNEAINSRRTLLSAEISLLNIMKKMEEYGKLRKLELLKKTTLKTRLKEANSEISKIRHEMPVVNLAKEKEETMQIMQEADKNLRLEDELKEIKEKLARLG